MDSLSVAPAAGDPAPEAAAPEEAVVWNYWLDRKREAAAVPEPIAGRLEALKPHHLQFRLSTLDLASGFERVGALTATPQLRAAIGAALAETVDQTVALDVLVHSVDEQRLRIDPASRHQAVKVDLNAVRAATLPSAPGLGLEDSTERHLRDATTAQFSVSFTPLVPGTHEVGIAIVESRSGFPVQTMIVRLTTGEEWPASVSVQASASSLLSSDSPPFDLALYLFDLRSTVDGEPYPALHAQLRYRDARTGRHAFVGWKAEMHLKALSDATATFHTMVGAIDSGPELLEEGHKIGRLLFDPMPDESKSAPLSAEQNLDNAATARRIIIAAASQRSGRLPPSMLVRIVGSSSLESSFSSEVLPIGAFGVSDGAAEQAIFLGERFALSLVLSGQRIGTTDDCPADWYMALPRSEDNNSGPLFDALQGLEPLISNWKAHVQRQNVALEQLKGWLSKPTGPSVFSYLGHHKQGHLFLKEGTAGIAVTDMRRPFASSIAILNACETAYDRVSEGMPIGRLARLKMAATVATTSKISGHLAAAYMDCLSAVLDAEKAITIGQAHALTTQCLWSVEQGQRWGKRYEFKGSALKYLLVGNPFQRICPPARKTDP
jgi:hypothetical protein